MPVDIEPIGDLSDKEVYDLLDEIEADEDQLKEETPDEGELKAQLPPEELELLEEAEPLELRQANGNWPVTKDKETGLFKLATPEEVEERREKSKRDKTESEKVKSRTRIQREAFQQDLIDLSGNIPKLYITRLVQLLTEKEVELENKYTAFLNRRFTMLLLPFIPRRLRICQQMYPESIRVSPGFMYKTPKSFGSKLFWAQPDIPVFFTQNTEQAILEESVPDYLNVINDVVARFYNNAEKKAKRQVNIATRLYERGVKTYYDLLKLDPMWYEKLYNFIKEENNAKTEKSTNNK